jgi:hypothetical protein
MACPAPMSARRTAARSAARTSRGRSEDTTQPFDREPTKR